MKKISLVVLIIMLSNISNITGQLFSKNVQSPDPFYPNPKLIVNLGQTVHSDFVIYNFNDYSHLRNARYGELISVLYHEKIGGIPKLISDGRMITQELLGREYIDDRFPGNNKFRISFISIDGTRVDHFLIGEKIIWNEKLLSIATVEDQEGYFIYKVVTADDFKILWETKQKIPGDYKYYLFTVYDSLWLADHDKFYLLDPLTGKHLMEFDNLKNVQTIAPNFVLLQKQNDKIMISLLVNTKEKKVLFHSEYENLTSFPLFFSDKDDFIEICRIYYTENDYSRYYCNLKRISSSNGEVKESYKVDLPAKTQPFQYYQDLSLIYENLVFVWVYNPSRLSIIDCKSNRIIKEMSMEMAHAVNYNGNIVIGDQQWTLGMQMSNLSVRWKIETPIVKERRIVGDKEYFLARVLDTINDVYALKVKIVNLIDNSLEPYEYFVSPMPGMSACICPTDIGVLFIPMISWPGKGYSIKLMRPGVPEPIYSITGEDHIFKEWKCTDNKDIIELISYSDKKALFSVPDGVLTWVVSEEN
jgi:hypothetical protein